MRPIVVAGIPSERPVRLVLEAAEKLGVPVALLNQRESQYIDMEVAVGADALNGYLKIRGTEYSLDRIRGVYVRLMDQGRLPENARVDSRGSDDLVRSHWMHRMLVDWLEVTPARVMNRASAMASNGSKPYQAQLITSVGFSTPATVVTNDPNEVRRFAGNHGKLIYKSVSSIRSIVRVLDPADNLEKIRSLPTQFQAFVEGTNIRVHTAGEKVFATEIRSDAVDYRYARLDGLSTDMVPLELPDDIAQKCRLLSRRLGLPLAGIDLKRTLGGAYVCFEVNPSPAFSYYQEHTGQPIAEGIVDYLAADT